MGLGGTCKIQAAQAPDRRCIAHAKMPGQKRHIYIGHMLRTRWVSQRPLNTLFGNGIHRGFLAARSSALAQVVQKIPHALFGHEKSGGKGIGSLFGPRLGVVRARNRCGFIAVHKRVTVFVGIRKPPSHGCLGEICQNCHAEIWATQKEPRDFIWQIQSRCPYILVG